MPFLRPDVLVLAAGGIVGEAWMSGVLAGIEAESDVDFRDVEGFVGTSAGSIVAASLAAGRRPRTPGAERRRGESAARSERGPRAQLGLLARAAGSVAGPLAPLALAAGTPGGRVARRAVLAAVPEGRRSLRQLRAEVDRWGARFDGRLRICTVERDSGRRVVFGAPSEPPASVGEAVEASCAVPGVFRPVPIGGRTYVDGGAWSLTNLDAARVGRGSQVLCLTVTGGPRRGLSAAGALRAAARPAVILEATALRRRGATVDVVGPDADLGFNLLDPRGAQPALEAGYRQGRRLAAARVTESA